MSQGQPGSRDQLRDDQLIETDSDDSDYTGADALANQGDSLSGGSELGSGSGEANSDESDDSDDSDYEDEEDEAGASNNEGSDDSEDGSGEDESSEGSSGGSVDMGNAPMTGYVFPAIHKLVAGGNVEAISSYLAEMFDPSSMGPQIWELPDSLGRNAIHLALLHCNIEILKVLLDYDRRNVMAKFSENGDEMWKFSAIRRKFDDMSMLHLAMWRAPWDEQTSIALLELLYTHEAIHIVPTTDYWKRNPLHIAAMTGKLEIVRFLGGKCVSWLFEKDTFNMLPVHYAIDTKNSDMLQLLINLSVTGDNSETFQTCLAGLSDERHLITHSVAKCSWECLVLLCRVFGQELPEAALEIAGGLGIELGGLSDISQNLEAAQKCVTDRSRETAVVYDLDCLGHIRLPSEMDDGHTRLKRIKFVVENPNRLEVLVGQHGSLKTREFQHVRVIDNVPLCPLSDVVRVHEWAYIQKLIQVAESAPSGAMVRLDKGDTNVTSESWKAALKASGAVIQAMDLVCSESCKTAFVAVRPPGHHVSSRGAVDPNLEDDDTGSNGFCLLNNVAIGAAYALCVHRHAINRVAIIDLDIHHGNGTEAIVRGLREPKTIQIPLTFTGLTGQLEMHSYHPWLDRNDADNVFFSSVHRFDGRFYPQSGSTGIDGNIVNAGLQSFSTSTDFRKALSHFILPQLVAFRPDIILISAGFDGHVRDRLASGEWDITEEDYYWATEQIVAIANTYCKGRIVSVLEGGYNTKGGWLSPLAQCVAAHVRALSSSWACKYVPPAPEEEEEEEDSDESFESDEQDHESRHVVEGITELLARADAVLNEGGESDASPQSFKRMRVDDSNGEFTQLFGNDQ